MPKEHEYEPDDFAAFHLRAVLIGVYTTMLLVLLGYLFLVFYGPRRGLQPQTFGAVLIVGGVGAVIVHRLPWKELIRRGRAMRLFHVWSVVNIVLVALAVAVSGGARSDLYLFYGMTTVFFAAVFPLRDQVALFGISILSYAAVLIIDGGHVDASTLMLRIGSLAMLAFLGGFLAAELRRQMSTHRHLALHDPLTGLANRTLFYDRVEQAMALARRDGKCAGVLVFDLDRFKEVNDTLGHSAGDALLVQIASRLSDKVIRRSDTIARMGGDEFAVVAPNIAPAAAVQQPARRILHALEAPFMIAGAEVRVGASVGFAIFPEDGEEVETLIEAADRRMYSSKSSSQPRPQASRSVAPA